MAEQKATHKSVVMTARIRVPCSGLFWQVRLAPTSLQSRGAGRGRHRLAEKERPIQSLLHQDNLLQPGAASRKTLRPIWKKTTQLNYRDNINSLKLLRIRLYHPFLNHLASFLAVHTPAEHRTAETNRLICSFFSRARTHKLLHILRLGSFSHVPGRITRCHSSHTCQNTKNNCRQVILCVKSHSKVFWECLFQSP